jgi:hypothetical protein
MNNKINILDNVSNINIVKKKALKNYGTSDVKPSTRMLSSNKKYMIRNNDGKYIHFGDIRYEDYTHHKDKQRRDNYLKRAVNMHGKWINDPFSPNWLSILLLWA